MESYLKKELISKIKIESEKAKDSFNTTRIYFDTPINGLKSIGANPISENNYSIMTTWSEIPAMTIAKALRQIKHKKYYVFKYIEGRQYKIRPKK